eukprot:scaffold10753_cov87-Skeletonema_marinoi.AAC.5
MGSASTHCCYCGGGIKTASQSVLSSKCQDYFNVLGIKDGVVAPLCEGAQSCSCPNATDHDIKPVTELTGVGLNFNETEGLYNECNCNFWLPLCEDKGGEACDYAAEYCCGDYLYDEDLGGFFYLDSPQCYCDFFNFAQTEFGHALKSKALNPNESFPNRCGEFEELMNYFMDNLASGSAFKVDIPNFFEKPSLMKIYEGTNGENWTNKAGWMDNTIDHCQWYGISCDDEGYVIGIDLRDNNLAGQFPTYTETGATFIFQIWMFAKKGLGNLLRLKRVDLANNKLTGTIDYRPLYNILSLAHFDVSGNQLGGEVDVLVTSSVTHADFSNNLFTSMHRFEKYKVSPLQTLRFCDVSNNLIEKDATDLLENIPPNIEQFSASNNEIHGELPALLNDLPKLSQFSMSSNALSGSLPIFADSILSLQELDLSNQEQTNGITGPISKDLWRFQSLKKLNLTGNKLTSIIPPSIGSMSVLEEFDLSNNLLESSIPSELGKLDGSLQFLGLSNNALSGIIPSQLGLLQDASVLLKGNSFNDSSTAPLSLSTLRSVKDFDLEDNVTMYPDERNALSEFYDSAKGAEWTNDTNWLDEYTSYCGWKGVTCNDMNQVTSLTLTNNGLSGRLSERIGNLTSIELLDLSDNDIKGSIPKEIGQLSELTYLRLSYNAFTGTAPEDLGELTKLQLLQLQSNRITRIPNMTQLDDSKYGNSTFVTDCGVPSAFNEAPKCQNCTMCCECYSNAPILLLNLHHLLFNMSLTNVHYHCHCT